MPSIPPPPPNPPRTLARLRVTQWGSLAIAILLGSALVALAVQNYGDAVAASKAITLGQGGRIFEGAQVDLSSRGQTLSDALAKAVEESHASYLAMWESGQMLASAGRTEFPGMAPTPLAFQMGPTHARMCFPGFLPGSPSIAESTPAWRKLPPDRVLVLEFLPSEEVKLARRALAAVWLSISAALLLTSAAAVLWNLGRRAERMRGELAQQEQLAKLGAMSAVLAHEIRNPLASLMGNAQLLAENPSDPRSGTRIERVVRDAIRLESLTNDLLAFARSGVVHATHVSPAEVLEAAAMAVDSERVNVSVSDAPKRWSLDADRLEQVLVNLLDNALRVTPAGQKSRPRSPLLTRN